MSAALESHAIVIDNAATTLVAEDGNQYPAPRQQASLLLPAGKTLDLTWTPTADTTYVVHDRALRLEAADQSRGGMVAKLHVGTPAGGPASSIATQPDNYSLAEGGALNVTTTALGVLGNDLPASGLTATLRQAPKSGTVALSATGTFLYTPNGNFNGLDTFVYTATNGTDTSTPTVVTISVTAVQNAPTAGAGNVSVVQRQSKNFNLSASDP